MARIRGMSMSMSIQLPDGGRVDVTDDTVVPMGDVRANRQLTYTHDGGAGRPACEVVFEVRGGVPMCARLTLLGADSETGVRAKDLKAIKLDELRADVFGYVGVFAPNPAGGWVRKVGRGSLRADRKHVEQAATRRKVTPQFLKRVAEIYNGAASGGRFEAVRAAFPDVEERQVHRYIAAARTEGFLSG
jgi:hypothetical protein